MPARNGTGPNGQGARTGRGLGNYRGPGGPGNGNRKRRGQGCGRGLGYCRNGADTRQGDSCSETRLDDLQAAVENTDRVS